MIGQVLKVKFMAFDPPLAQVVPRMFAIQVPAATTKHSEQDIDKISIPREELEDVMLAELQVTVACAKRARGRDFWRRRSTFRGNMDRCKFPSRKLQRRPHPRNGAPCRKGSSIQI